MTACVMTNCQDSFVNFGIDPAVVYWRMGLPGPFRSGAILGAIVAAFGLAACDRLPGTPQNEARSALLATLYDPGSAQIVYASTTPKAVCGAVNARNRMGGYAGRAPFIFLRNTRSFVPHAEPPTFEDYRLLVLMSEGPERANRWEEINTGCRFPAAWKENCAAGGDAPPDNAEFCKLFLTQQWVRLYDLAYAARPGN